MARRPRTLKVGPFTYRFVADPTLTTDGGITDVENHVIIVCAPLRGPWPDSTKGIAVHEALHALFDACGLAEKFLRGPRPSEESAIVDLAVPLLAFMRDNPGFVAWVTEKRSPRPAR